MKKATSERSSSRRTVYMLVETLIITVGFGGITLCGFYGPVEALMWLGALGQGIWFQRVYCVGHEAAHEKLFPKRPFLNNGIGQVFLWIILVPLPIFKKIHRFHHGSNRRDIYTSALEIYPVKRNAGVFRRFLPRLWWYGGIAAGGWFLHSLLSIVFFLVLPQPIARKVSPAFRGWTYREQMDSLALFAAPIAGHVLFYSHAPSLWWCSYGVPLLIFAWVYSIQLYVYHYRTTLGPKTLLHARRLNGPPILGWWLLNLNQHDTHHRHTKIPWHELPRAGEPLPSAFRSNQNVHSFWDGICQQFQGPTLVDQGKVTPLPENLPLVTESRA